MLTEQATIHICNQLYEALKKCQDREEFKSLKRNLSRIESILGEHGYTIYNPLNETYDETRTDCEATIAGEISQNLRITDVIKPIITSDAGQRIIQKGVVIVTGAKA